MKTIGEVAHARWAAQFEGMSTWEALPATERRSWEMAAAARITEGAMLRGQFATPRVTEFVCGHCQRRIKFRTCRVVGETGGTA